MTVMFPYLACFTAVDSVMEAGSWSLTHFTWRQDVLISWYFLTLGRYNGQVITVTTRWTAAMAGHDAMDHNDTPNNCSVIKITPCVAAINMREM